jgi:hypothetical protein
MSMERSILTDWHYGVLWYQNIRPYGTLVRSWQDWAQNQVHCCFSLVQRQKAAKCPLMEANKYILSRTYPYSCCMMGHRMYRLLEPQVDSAQIMYGVQYSIRALESLRKTL